MGITCLKTMKIASGIVFIAVLCTIVPEALASNAYTMTRTCSISSDHPYWNSENLSWPVGEMGAMACRVNFSHLIVETENDFVILNSSVDEIKITGNYPDGCWSDWVVGTSFTLRLMSNEYITDYGFDVVTYEIQLPAAWDAFWWVAIPVLVAIAAILITLEVRARQKPAKSLRKVAQPPRHPY